MPLTTTQLDEVLKYSAFEHYTAPQKKTLREQLAKTNLEYPQIEFLWGEQVGAGLVNDLIADSQESESAARQLGNIIENIKESINPDYGYSPTPIIQNLLGRLGAYNEVIAQEVIDWVKQHAQLCNARIILSTANNLAAEHEEGVHELERPPEINPIGVNVDEGTTLLSLLVASAPDLFPMLASRLTAEQMGSLLDAYAQRLNAPINHSYSFFAQQQVPLQHEREPELIETRTPGLAVRDEAAMMEDVYGFFALERQNPARSQAEQLVELDRVLLLNPDDFDARLQRASLLADPDTALFDFNYILEREPTNVAALLGRAKINDDMLIYSDRDEHATAALVDYQQVLELEPQNAIALAAVGRLLVSAPRPD